MKIKAVTTKTYIISWHGMPTAHANTYHFQEVIDEGFVINICKLSTDVNE